MDDRIPIIVTPLVMTQHPALQRASTSFETAVDALIAIEREAQPALLFVTHRGIKLVRLRIEEVLQLLAPHHRSDKRCNVASRPLRNIGERSRQLAQRALKVIDAELGSELLTPARVALRCNVSHSHLCRVLKHTTGQSLSRIIHTARMEEARRLLSFNDSRIKEIATAVGYRNTRRFDEHFFREYGVCPSDFRRDAVESAFP